MAQDSGSNFIFRRHDHIGALEAEEDGDFLEECFVDNGFIGPLLDITNSKRILIGRTGSGKSAIIAHILATQPGALRIEPERMALEHLYTTTILGHLDELDVRMDVFFKLLWKHTIVIGLLRRHFNEDTEGGYFFSTARKYFSSKKHPLALKYLEQWAGSFWNETNYGMESITQSFIDRLEDNAELKALFYGTGASIGTTNVTEMGSEKRAEIRRIAQDIINKSQVRELGQVLRGLNEVFPDPQKPQYICVDGLDENWACPSLRYQLVKALIQVSREFRVCKTVKPIIVIRADLMQRVFRDTRYDGEQHEKYAALSIGLDWSRSQLEELLDNRTSKLVRRRYTKRPVTAREVLPESLRVGRSKSPITGLDYLLDRTLLRPRDAIRFVNACIALSDGEKGISPNVLREAEGAYSSERLTAICDEWSSEFPFLRQTISEIVNDRVRASGRLRVSDISAESLMNIAIQVSDADQAAPIVLREAAQEYASTLSEARQLEFVRQVVLSLFNIGIVGLKLNAHTPFRWVERQGTFVAATQIVPATIVEIHRMFHTALSINS